ncbi:putative ABC transport system permease protein [Chitinivorax tropicus]|uniref:Putative ABC transport system permease protein n=1 Tax=Chitinivorax tropicus TaxID=714531 RepID=A0A840MQN2_9PROT|nr:ABC transporter permease [Chitinivorax tropicus]MBB5019397.1 putative ABC transport system permease protein [Chitinivorax tropicus]
MSLLHLAWRNLVGRPLTTILNLLLLALGIGTISAMLLFSSQLEQRLQADASGIDLVVGAKGSPLQLILSSVYHADVPNGNIPLTEANKLRKNPMVAKAVPLALGDSYHGIRIVGTDPSYLDLYGAKVAQGRIWKTSMEVVVGADAAAATGLKLDQEFASSHGLAPGGDLHDDNPFQVVGILQKTGTVLDKLILTPVQSVWDTHEGSSTATTEDNDEEDAGKEITALLIKYRSPMAAAIMPRVINSQSSMQAAAPAMESARLWSLIGFGLDAYRANALVLIIAATLSVFVAFYNTLRERRYDLAVMRMLGAGRFSLLWVVLLEGLLLAGLAALVGLGLGHGLTEGLATWLGPAQSLGLTGHIWLHAEWLLIAGALGVGTLAAIIPAIAAYRTDVARTLTDS